MKVICISAKARHGKDSAAEILKDHLESLNKKVLIIHYADLLKFICTKFFNWDGNKDEKGRSILQHVGTDIVGAKKPDYWVDFVISFLQLFPTEWDYVLVPDCRFPVEVTKMKKHFNTTTLRIERPNFDNGLTFEQKQHPSEVSLDDYSFDATIYNSGSLSDFKDTIINWFVNDFLLD